MLSVFSFTSKDLLSISSVPYIRTDTSDIEKKNVDPTTDSKNDGQINQEEERRSLGRSGTRAETLG
jgi:hypothetical protein